MSGCWRTIRGTFRMIVLPIHPLGRAGREWVLLRGGLTELVWRFFFGWSIDVRRGLG